MLNAEECPRKYRCAVPAGVECCLAKEPRRSPRKRPSGWYSNASRSLRTKTGARGLCENLRLLYRRNRVTNKLSPSILNLVFQGSNDKGSENPVSNLEAASGGLGHVRDRNVGKAPRATHKEPSFASGTGRVSRRRRCLRLSDPWYRSGMAFRMKGRRDSSVSTFQRLTLLF